MDSELDSKSNGYIVLTEHVHITQTQTRILISYFCIGQESESESVSDNVNEPLRVNRPLGGLLRQMDPKSEIQLHK